MNILTIDLEEWYTYILFKKGVASKYEPILENYLDDILNLLDSRKIKATFFCLGIIARSHPHIIRKIYEQGHDIGCHSDKHHFLTKLTPTQLKEDTYTALDSLEQCIGKKIVMYRAPAFTITQSNKWALEILIDAGIEVDCSIFSANRSYGGFSSLDIKIPTKLNTQSGVILEFPMNFTLFLGQKIIYTGGGYFRIFPYYLLKYLFNDSEYNMTYFHLRDFDVYQKPVYNERFILNYLGIKGAFNKFHKLIDEFNFVSLSQAILETEDTKYAYSSICK